MTDKEKYVNVAELKKKVRYWAKARGMLNASLRNLLSAINSLPVTAKGDLEATLEVANAEWKTCVNPDDENDIEVCCSSCHRINDFPSAYCPFCGKHMKD